jgi:hypothetical protein
MTDTARWKSTVYVGGLAPAVTTTALQEAFLPFGEIADVALPKNENPSTAAAEPHRGFAYVEFEDAEDAKEAIDNMDQAELFGRVIKVSAAKAPKSAAGQGGLGGKTAVWEQVGFSLFLLLRLILGSNWLRRKDGWPRMRLARRTGWLRTRLRTRGPTTRCRGWRGWMLPGRSRNDGVIGESSRRWGFIRNAVQDYRQAGSRVWHRGRVDTKELHSYGVGAGSQRAFVNQGNACLFTRRLGQY